MKVYWSRCGHGHGNFGDKLTPMLLRHFGIPVEWSPPEHAELIGVGSILEKVPKDFKGTIWTSGFMHGSSHLHFSTARVLGVRGQLTLERVDCLNHEHTIVGDAGLLCDELSPPARKKYKLGIIPHFVDADDPFVKALAGRSRDTRVIDICAEPDEVMRTTSECENILSSSLHGLILADSLGIPNRWLELNRGPEIVTGGGFKYRDYYSTFGLAPEPFRLTGSTSLDEVLSSIDDTPRLRLQEIKSSLRTSVLEIKKEIRPLSGEELRAKQEAADDWQRRLAELQHVVEEIIPKNARVVVADEEQLRTALSEIQGVPFMERNGVYWGPPGSEEEAIQEVKRQVRRGVTWFVIAWPMFWAFKKYPGLSAHLHGNFELCHDSAIGRIFQLKRTSSD